MKVKYNEGRNVTVAIENKNKLLKIVTINKLDKNRIQTLLSQTGAGPRTGGQNYS